jgi:hypothetical protein
VSLWYIVRPSGENPIPLLSATSNGSSLIRSGLGYHALRGSPSERRECFMTAIQIPVWWIEGIARLYLLALIATFALMPMGLILYLDRFQTPSLLFMDHTFHVIAIAVATIEVLFVSYVSWRCYRRSGEPFVRWLTLGFLGFTVIYAPHGFFTPLAHDHPWLFASRRARRAGPAPPRRATSYA